MGSLSVQTKNGDQESYDLNDATIYLEKNWGCSFPSKWWWIQANTFHSDLCVTATAGCRGIPFLGQEEEVGLVGLHWNGRFLPFPNVDWNVKWGRWAISGQYNEFFVKLTGTCHEKGFPVNCPTPKGMKPNAMEIFSGTLRVELFENGQKVLDDDTEEACLEVGGLPWTSKNWNGNSDMKEPIKSVAMNVKLERRVSDILQAASRFIEIPGL